MPLGKEAKICAEKFNQQFKVAVLLTKTNVFSFAPELHLTSSRVT